MKLRKIIKIFSGLVIILFIAFSTINLNPGQLKLIFNIYRSYNYTKSVKSEIISPVKQQHNIEDTYGTPRPGGRWHQGIDIFCEPGTELLAVFNGKIVFRGEDKLGGKVVYLLGNDNRLYYYAHLSDFSDIKTNINQGEVIGYAGNSGNAIHTPCHLHFEVMVIKWIVPMVYGNINPYPILIEAKKITKYQ